MIITNSNKQDMLKDENLVLQHAKTTLNIEKPKLEEFLKQASESYEHGDLTQTRKILEEARSLLIQNHVGESTLELLNLLGRVYRDQGHYELAKKELIQTTSLAKQKKLHAIQIDALNLLASVFSISGYDNRALDYLNDALKISTEYKLDKKRANILTNIGRINLQLGNYPESITSNKLAYKIYQKLDPFCRDSAVNLVNIGLTYLGNSDFDSTKYYFNKVIDLNKRIQDHSLESVALNNLGFAYLNTKDYDKALKYFIKALQLAQTHNNKQFQIDNLDGIAQVYEAQKQYKHALKIYLNTITIAKELNSPESILDAILGLGKSHIALNSYKEAILHLVRGLEIAQTLEYPEKIFELHKLLASAYKKQNETSLALFHYEKFHEIEKQVFNEKSEEAIHKLTVKFDLERAERNAEEYHSQKLIAEKATEEAERLVKLRTHELESSRIEIVMRLAQAAEFRDEDTGEHTFRVGRNAAAIAYCLGWSIEDIKLLYLASRLHDVGKIGVSDTVLLKPGKLTDDEFELIRKHTVIGAKILADGKSSLLRMAESIALAHHERWDGFGYPNKLAGSEIPISARIVSVVDVLDALTHARPYKKAWSIIDALDEIEDNAGKQFDPQITDIALLVFSPKKGISPTDPPLEWGKMIEQFEQLFSEQREKIINLSNTTD